MRTIRGALLAGFLDVCGPLIYEVTLPPRADVHHRLHRWGIRLWCRRAVRPAGAFRRGHRGLGPVAHPAGERVVRLRVGVARVRVGARGGVRRGVCDDIIVRGVGGRSYGLEDAVEEGASIDAPSPNLRNDAAPANAIARSG